MEKNKLNLDGPSFTGIGDACIQLWLHPHVEFYAESEAKTTLCRMFDIPLIDSPDDCEDMLKAYHAELKDRGSQSRLDYMQQYLHIAVEPKRPAKNIPYNAWTDYHVKKLGRRKIVVLCPQTVWKPREWGGACYWIWLAWQLRLRQYAPVIFLNQPQDEYASCPVCFYEQPLENFICFLNKASLVVGVDSGPIHIAANLGVRGLALMGPTQADCIFGHAKDCIETISSDKNCNACHYSPAHGYCRACDFGCRSLMELKPENVLAKCLEMLQRPLTVA